MEKLPPIINKSASKVSLKKSSRSSVSSKRKSLTENKERVSKEIIKEECSNTIVVSLPKTYDYRKELTLLFFNSMLETLIDEYKVQENAVEPAPPAVNIETVEKNFKEISTVDLNNSEIVFVKGSSVFLQKKSSSNESFNRKKSSDARQHSLKSMGSMHSQRTASKVSSLESDKSMSWVVSCVDEKAEIFFKNGNYYCGDISRKVMHGTGKYVWSNGTIYEGEFKNGYPQGKGIIILPDLSVYEGEFVKGEFHGYGSLKISSEKMIFCGNWKNGKKHGKGWLLYQPGNWYEGEWYEDFRQGFGFRYYSDSAKYKGNWYQGMPNGFGKMVFDNNDFYRGEWKNGYMEGYGEYTWNSFFNKTFSFPLNTYYKGTWLNGKRNGVGLMNFGSESGTKLIGIFFDNLKDGPGVVVCGNGQCFQRNPLFQSDKSVQYQIANENVNTTPNSENQFENQDENPESCYHLLLNEINRKEALNEFSSNILSEMDTGPSMSKHKFVKVRGSSDNVCSPLEIPLHAMPESVNLSYYIDKIIAKLTFKNDPFVFEDENETDDQTTDRSNYDISKINYFSLNSVTEELISLESVKSDVSRKLLVIKVLEEKKLRNTIALNLPLIRKIYDKYAKIATNQDIYFKPLLIRLFLWQLYRDIGLTSRNLSLIEIDLDLAANPQSFLESTHNPFETLYLWQFIQSLVGTACLLYFKTEEKGVLPTEGVVSYIFKTFLHDLILPNMENDNGLALRKYKDLLPITQVYSLYLKIGEPHTVRDFLRKTCVKKFTEPPSYVTLLNEESAKVVFGKNTVPLDREIDFIPNKVSFEENMENVEIKNEDKFSNTLYALRHLGPKVVTECMIKVCPQIVKDCVIVNMNYQLSFLEFYEILLLCAYTHINIEMEKEETARKIEELLMEAQENTSKESMPSILK